MMESRTVGRPHFVGLDHSVVYEGLQDFLDTLRYYTSKGIKIPCEEWQNRIGHTDSFHLRGKFFELLELPEISFRHI